MSIRALRIGLVGILVVVLGNPAEWMRLLTLGLGRWVLKVERVGTELMQEPRLDRLKALGVLRLGTVLIGLLSRLATLQLCPRPMDETACR